jgi:hypothetical protein
MLEESDDEASNAREFRGGNRGGWDPFGEHLDRTATATGKAFAV